MCDRDEQVGYGSMWRKGINVASCFTVLGEISWVAGKKLKSQGSGKEKKRKRTRRDLDLRYFLRGM